MIDLKGKRLLLLGGSLWKHAIKDYANNKGIVLIATGNNQSAGIFQIADERYNVDSTDEAAMKQLIMDKRIDGVYMGGSEAVCSIACKYLHELKLHCYCTKEQWDFLENKASFKALCEKNGLPVVKRYQFQGEKKGSSEIVYPVITKPTDGSGSNGFSICNNFEELLNGYEAAKKESPSGSVIVEKFVKNDSVVAFYTFSGGKMFFSGLEEKFPVYYVDQGRYVAGAHVFESRFIQDFRNRFEAKLEKMFRSIGIQEGPIWIEVFHDGDQYYFNEAGYRYSGSVSIYPVDYFHQINQVAADINFALTGKSLIEEKKEYQTLIDNRINRKEKYCIYSIHVAPGVITNVTGLEDLLLMDSVVAIPVTKSIGDVVSATGTIGQVFAFVHFVFNTDRELMDMIDYIHEKLIVLDSYGNNLVRRMVDPNQITERLFSTNITDNGDDN